MTLECCSKQLHHSLMTLEVSFMIVICLKYRPQVFLYSFAHCFCICLSLCLAWRWKILRINMAALANIITLSSVKNVCFEAVSQCVWGKQTLFFHTIKNLLLLQISKLVRLLQTRITFQGQKLNLKMYGKQYGKSAYTFVIVSQCVLDKETLFFHGQNLSVSS